MLNTQKPAAIRNRVSVCHRQPRSRHHQQVHCQVTMELNHRRREFPNRSVSNMFITMHTSLEVRRSCWHCQNVKSWNARNPHHQRRPQAVTVTPHTSSINAGRLLLTATTTFTMKSIEIVVLIPHVRIKKISFSYLCVMKVHSHYFCSRHNHHVYLAFIWQRWRVCKIKSQCRWWFNRYLTSDESELTQ